MDPLVLGIALIALGITWGSIKALLWYVDPKRLERAAIARQLESGGHELVDGATVTLTGIAHVGARQLKSPIRCIECIAYEVRAELAARDGSLSPRDVERIAAVPFTLVTDQGEIAIEPTPTPKADVIGEVAFLRSFGTTADNLCGNDIEEVIVRHGDRVVVAGVVAMAAAVPSGDLGYREARNVPRIVDHPRFPLRIRRAER